jgi:mRNA interferase RelE/StbE
MGYKVVYDPRAFKTLQKMDKTTQRLIIAYIDKYLIDCENPRAVGKVLSADRAGQWRYRIGSYRILATIKDTEVTIYILKIGHRREVYKN